MIHRVVVYLRPDRSLAHVQSTNGDQWPGLIEERDKAGNLQPLRRIELELEATPEEVAAAENERPRHRKASALFRDELEYDPGRDSIRYRPASGRRERIAERVPVEISGPPHDA